MKGLRRTGGHTGRFLPFLEKIEARIALLHLSVAPETDRTKRAGPQAGVAADALVLVNKDHSISPFLDRALRANRLAGRLPTMHTGHGNASMDHRRVFSLPETDHSSPPEAGFRTVKTLAGHLAGMALNASVGIEKESELTDIHSLVPSLLSLPKPS